MSKGVQEQLKFVHQVAPVLDPPNRITCVHLLRCNVEEPETSYAQVLFLAEKKEEDKFQQIVSLENEPRGFFCLLDKMKTRRVKVFLRINPIVWAS